MSDITDAAVQKGLDSFMAAFGRVPENFSLFAAEVLLPHIIGNLDAHPPEHGHVTPCRSAHRSFRARRGRGL